jgi:hypothetical protein
MAIPKPDKKCKPLRKFVEEVVNELSHNYVRLDFSTKQKV